MKKTMTALLLLLAVAIVPAAAQKSDKENKNAQKRTEKMAAQIAKQLDLDDATTDWFKALYVQYQDSLRAVRSKGQAAQPADDKEKSSEKKELTEAEAAQLIEDGFAASIAEVDVKRYFYKAFLEKLTSVQLVNIFAGGPGGGMPGGMPGGNQQRQGGGMPGGGMPGGGFGGGGFDGDF